MKKILILSNHHLYTYKFRKEIIEGFLKNGDKVYLALPYGEYVEKLIKMGCEFTDVPLDRRGTNIVNEMRLLYSYYKLIKNIKPDYVISYTIKPNIYGGILCRLLKVKNIPNITGLGSAFNKSKVSYVFKLLYKMSFEKAYHVLFQNTSDFKQVKSLGVKLNNYSIIPGSGINVKENKYLDYPIENNKINLLFIGRIMKEKGIGELAEAASILKKEFSNIEFTLIGFCEEDFKSEFERILKMNVFNYEGFQDNTDQFIKKANAIVLPTYSEGMSNVLLEASIKGRPVLASNVPGCKEIIEQNNTGFLFEPKDPHSIVEAIRKFMSKSAHEKEQMGIRARKKVKNEFSREIIVNKYLEITNQKEG